MKNDQSLSPKLKTATDAALAAKEAYRTAEAELIRALTDEGLLPRLPGEPTRDYQRRVRMTARDWITMHEPQPDFSAII